jgi:hypothetical protein
MLLKRYKYYFFIFVFVKCSINCRAQIFPSNIVWQQNFGKGTSDPNVVGPPIATGHTEFTYSNLICPLQVVTQLSGPLLPPCKVVLAGMDILVHDHDHELNPSLDFGMFMLVNDTSISTIK